MGKVTAANALRLKEYIDAIDDFHLIVPEPCLYEDHIGALFTDTILQAGVNYKRVVWPRVKYVLETFPYADTVHSFSKTGQIDTMPRIREYLDQWAQVSP